MSQNYRSFEKEEVVPQEKQCHLVNVAIVELFDRLYKLQMARNGGLVDIELFNLSHCFELSIFDESLQLIVSTPGIWLPLSPYSNWHGTFDNSVILCIC